ncbi:MAG: cysteine hydrolase family protein, partial [Gammaproteobacteria bacterium]
MVQTASYTRPDLDKAALVTVDVQRDTLAGQPFEIPGTSEALPRIAEIAQVFRRCAQPIIHVIRLYRPDGSNAELCRRQKLESGDQLFLSGSDGRKPAAEIMPAPDIVPDDELLLAGQFQGIGPVEKLMYKPRWGAFFATPLHQEVTRLGCNTIVLAGINYPNCIRATLYGASERDYRIIAVSDGISNFDARGWQELKNIGVVVKSASELVHM